MLTTSLLNKFERVIVSKGENAFYNPNDGYYKRKTKLNQLFNLLDSNDLLNTEGLQIIENIPADKFENYIMHRLINVIPSTINREIINDETNHVSSLSQTIAEYYKNNKFVKTFYESRKIDSNQYEGDKADEFKDIKETIILFKKSNDDYSAFVGHLLEDIVGLLIGEHHKNTNKNKQCNNIINELSAVLNELKANIDMTLIKENTPGNSYYVIHAIISTIKEVKTKDKDNVDKLNSVKSFVSDILTDELLLTALTKYIEYLRNQINVMLEDILKNTKKCRLITKHRVDYRGVMGETDYIIECLKGGNSILADCKVYNNITPDTMNKFVFQLIGYYHQHTLLKTTPSYYGKFPFNIGRFMIINPLDNNYEFSYYVINIQDHKKDFDDMLTIWDKYIMKCLNCSKHLNEN